MSAQWETTRNTIARSVSGKRRASSTSALTAPAPAVKREYSYMFDEEDRRKVHQPSYSNRRTFSGMIATTPILRSFNGLKGAGSDSRSPQNFNSSSGNSSGTSTPLSSSKREPDSSSPQASSDKVCPRPPASSFQKHVARHHGGFRDTAGHAVRVRIAQARVGIYAALTSAWTPAII